MDPQLAAMDHSPYAGSVTSLPPQADVDDFLRKKRKAREHKACYPCRQRKVKCDLSRPCQTCRDREHPELCSYHPPNKRQNVQQVPKNNHGGALKAAEDDVANVGFGTGSVTLARGEFDMLCRRLTGLENSIAELRHELRNGSHENGFHTESDAAGSVDGPNHATPSHLDVHGLHTQDKTGETVHLGGGSIPAMLYAFSQGQTASNTQQTQLTEFLGKSVLPLFGLDNESATYPFVDLWGLPHAGIQRARELAKALPHDAQMLSLFRCYAEMGHLIFPGVADTRQLETDLTMFLLNRASHAGTLEGVTENEIYGRSYYWLGMLFAVLGSGAQCSAMQRKERELTAQVYVCCAFECLRFTNFISVANLESIQTLLVIGNVMANNMNAGTAWSLLGLTIRLAQGLGLHQASPPYVSHDRVLPRSRVWWAVIWLDSLLSITYDRAGALNVRNSGMPMPQHYGSVSPYHASMYRLCKIVLDIVNDRSKSMTTRELVACINQRREEFATIMRESAEYLRDSRKCTSGVETLEHWCLYMHTSYALSELCRPAISPRFAGQAELQPFRSVCVENLTNTVEAFLGLTNISAYSRQSWGSVHRGLSSALLLGILGEHRRSDRAQKLVARLVSVMTDLTASVDPQEISAPMQRGIDALAKMQSGSVNFNLGEQPEFSSASRTDSSISTMGWRMPPSSSAVSTIAGSMSSTAVVGGAEDDRRGSAGGDQKVMQILTPATSEGVPAIGPGGENEASPYSVLNSILWGGNMGVATPETFSV